MDTDLPDALLDALDRIDECLAADDLAGARDALASAAEVGGADHPEVLYSQACIVWQQRGLQAAVPILERVIALVDDHADAHHALGRGAEEREDREEMIARYLRVHALDAKVDREARLGSAEQLDHIEAVARELLGRLPSPFAERLTDVPVVLDARPSRALVCDGFDPRSLGLFEGRVDGDSETPSPTRIVLFVNNLLAEFPEEPDLSQEIEVTLLHEIGHFFGLDEDDMVRLGLD